VASKQGDLALLQHPAAQAMLRATIPARLAYTWTDGTPRVVPIWFHWTGEELVMGTSAAAPKVKALRRDPRIAVTIDQEGFPAQVLLLRGTAQLQEITGVVPEYAEAARRYMGDEQGRGWAAQAAQMFPKMVRIALKPAWVGVIDFRERFPSPIESAMSK
jgi:PPOX class probable F420-dependent enzyme